MEQMDTALRHMMDHGLGQTKDTDGMYHMAKAAWRCLAELQLTIERDRADAAGDAIDPNERAYQAEVMAGTIPIRRTFSAGSRVRVGRCDHVQEAEHQTGWLIRIDETALPEGPRKLPYYVRLDHITRTHGNTVWCENVEVLP